MNRYPEEKMIQEAGTPALLCFKPEEQPTDCRTTSFINRMNQGTLHSNVVCAYSEPGRSLLTVSTAPIIELYTICHYIKFSVKKKHQSSLIYKRDNNNILAFGNVGSIVQSRFNVLFGKCWKIVFYDFLSRYISGKQLKNLPYHDSCSFEGRSTSADFAVRDNVLVDFNSHGIDDGYLVFKDFVSPLRSRFSELWVANFSTKFGCDWVAIFRTGKMVINVWFSEKRLKIDWFE